jgi:hypothetical protein
MTTNRFNSWKRPVNPIKMETDTIHRVYKNFRVPWFAKNLSACVVVSFIRISIQFERPRTKRVFPAGGFNACMLILPEMFGTHEHILLYQGGLQDYEP